MCVCVVHNLGQRVRWCLEIVGASIVSISFLKVSSIPCHQATVLGAVAVASSGLMKQWSVTIGKLIIVLILTQLGFGRETRQNQVHAMFTVFFLIVTLMLASLTFASAIQKNGWTFPSSTPDWCDPGTKHCTNFTFPLTGL